MSYIKINWDQFLFRSWGSVLAYGSCHAAYLGVKNLTFSVFGTQGLQQRIDQARKQGFQRTTMPSIFFGNHTVSQRITFLKKSGSYFLCSVPMAFLSYICLFRMYGQPPVTPEQPSPPSPDIDPENSEPDAPSPAPPSPPINYCKLNKDIFEEAKMNVLKLYEKWKYAHCLKFYSTLGFQFMTIHCTEDSEEEACKIFGSPEFAQEFGQKLFNFLLDEETKRRPFLKENLRIKREIILPYIQACRARHQENLNKLDREAGIVAFDYEAFCNNDGAIENLVCKEYWKTAKDYFLARDSINSLPNELSQPNCMTMLKEKYFDGVEGIQELKKISNFKDEKRLIQGTQKDLTHL